MTIRKTLVITFLLASLLPSALLTFLAFKFTGDEMHKEIELTQQVQASTISQDIDKMIFERLQNAKTWGRLEVMQDIQVKDIDKRISKFLAEVKSGYRDVYHQLDCIDSNGSIIASSNQTVLGKLAIQDNDKMYIPMQNTDVWLDTFREADNDRNIILPINTAIKSIFNGSDLGRVRLQFNWSQIYQILDQASTETRMALLVDYQGRVIAASSSLRKQDILMKVIPESWQSDPKTAVVTRDGTFIGLNQITIGRYRSRGFEHFSGFGWTTLVIQSSSQAFVPIQRIAFIFLLLLVITSCLAIVFSLFISKRIAQPITELTAFTRQFTNDNALPAIPKKTTGEVGELTAAFVQTVEKLDQSRAQLIRASKLAVLGELSAVMAHEIRTPIGILRSSAQMLAREPGLSEEGKELVSFVESETERLKGLVSALLESARMPQPMMQGHNLNNIILQCVALLSLQAENKSIEMSVELKSDSPTLFCDAEQIKQVLLNLIMNALQIIPAHGKVLIACNDDSKNQIIEVEDDGPGIGTVDQARVFDPFYTKRDGGVGLGLSVVQQIVSAHHGEITVGKSKLGGALFSIVLPKLVKEL